MTPRRIALAVLTATAFVSLQFVLPAKAQSQGEMTETAWGDFHKVDEKLNVVYNKVLATSEDDIGRQKLVVSEKAWIKYRDAERELYADSARGGSMAPMLRALSCTDTTNARIAELKQYLTTPDGK